MMAVSFREINLVCVRHGESEANEVKVMDGCGPSNLTRRGIEQARQVGLELRRLCPDGGFHVWLTSNLSRAVKTAEIAAKEQRTDPVIYTDPLLRERNFGIFEGKPPTLWLKAAMQEKVAHWYSMTPDGGESVPDVQIRAKQLLEAICFSKGFLSDFLPQNPLNLVVFSHGCFLMEFATLLRNLQSSTPACPYTPLQVKTVPNLGSISCWRIRLIKPPTLQHGHKVLSAGALNVEWLLFRGEDHLFGEASNSTAKK